MRTLAAHVLLTLVLPASLVAQTEPPRLPTGDLGAAIGWLHSETSSFTGSEHHWTHAQATLAVHAGYYWTEHLKTEGILERSTTVTTWSSEQAPAPGGLQAYSSGLHDIGYTRASIIQFYQFGHNAWLHGALGGGAAITARRVFSRFQPLTYYDRGGLHVLAPSRPDGEVTETLVRPCAAAVLKAYVTPRVFFRSDVQTDFRSTLEHVVIRAGIGVDF